MSDYLPWQGENSKRKFNWYMIQIDLDKLSEMTDNKETPYYYASALYEQIDGAFCENEWIFHQFISFYNMMLGGVEYKIIEANDMTFGEYDNYIHRKQKYRLNPSWYIFRWEIKWLNISVYLTDQMIEGMYESTSECDPMIEVFADSIYGGWQFLKQKNSYLINSKDIQTIYQLLHKICTVYYPIYVFIVEGDYEGNWVDALPQNVKDVFTKYVTFPKPLKEIKWTDIQESTYLFYFYLVRCCGYPGILADDEPEDTEGE